MLAHKTQTILPQKRYPLIKYIVENVRMYMGPNFLWAYDMTFWLLTRAHCIACVELHTVQATEGKRVQDETDVSCFLSILISNPAHYALAYYVIMGYQNDILWFNNVGRCKFWSLWANVVVKHSIGSYRNSWRLVLVFGYVVVLGELELYDQFRFSGDFSIHIHCTLHSNANIS